MSVYTYAYMKSQGIIDNTMIIHPVYDKLIPLNHINHFLFGVSSIPKTTCKAFLVMHNIIIEYNNTLYLILSKMKEYIEAIGTLDNYTNEYILINYYNFINKELTGIQNDIYNFNQKFIEYLEKEKPLFYSSIINIFGKKYFNGKFIASETITGMISILYNNIMITYGNSNMNAKLYVNLYDYEFKKIYEDIKNEYLLNDIDLYVKYNLIAITQNESFADLLVTSHNMKEYCCISIDIVNNIIAFKNNNTKEKYIERFTKLYKINTIWTIIDNIIYLNFEGLNKYFLNLERADLISDEMKEIVSEFYYNITNELINSYKTLYNYLKK